MIKLCISGSLDGCCLVTAKVLMMRLGVRRLEEPMDEMTLTQQEKGLSSLTLRLD